MGEKSIIITIGRLIAGGGPLAGLSSGRNAHVYLLLFARDFGTGYRCVRGRVQNRRGLARRNARKRALPFVCPVALNGIDGIISYMADFLIFFILANIAANRRELYPPGRYNGN